MVGGLLGVPASVVLLFPLSSNLLPGPLPTWRLQHPEWAENRPNLAPQRNTWLMVESQACEKVFSGRKLLWWRPRFCPLGWWEDHLLFQVFSAFRCPWTSCSRLKGLHPPQNRNHYFHPTLSTTPRPQHLQLRHGHFRRSKRDFFSTSRSQNVFHKK